jgi:hypothetical protein
MSKSFTLISASSRISILVLVLICNFCFSSLAQSKKKQISTLTSSLDSVALSLSLCEKSLVDLNDTLVQKNRAIVTSQKQILTLEHNEKVAIKTINDLNDTIAGNKQSLSNLKTSEAMIKNEMNSDKKKFDSLLLAYSLKQKTIEHLETEFRQLKKQSEYKPHTYYHTQYSVSSDYARQITEDLVSYFNVNSAAIIEKEKPRIINSISAKRLNDVLAISTKTDPVYFKNERKGYEEFDYEHTFYTYLFEDLAKGKVYCIEFKISYTGGGQESYSLIQIDLKNGNIHKFSDEINHGGGDFYFNSDNSTVVICGWFSTGNAPFPMESVFSIVNLDKRKTELTIDESEIMNLTWLNERSFSCQLIKYEIVYGDDYVDDRFDRLLNYYIPFSVFTGKDGKWIESKP